jgi:hypothetical protein
MANAMGLLQVARYVVKVRVMGAGNQWRTEMAVYAPPANDGDVAELLDAIREEDPEVRRVQVIPPTTTAINRATKRRAKLAKDAVSRLPEFRESGPTSENTAKPQVGPDYGVSRESGNPGVLKKTISKKTTEDDHSRPSVRSPEVGAREADGTDGWTDGGGGFVVQEEQPAAAGGRVPAAAGASLGNDKSAATGAGVGRGVPAAVAPVVVTPGVEVLRAIGAEFPRWELDADALRDKGLLVTGMLESGFTAAEIRDAFARRMPPRPEDLTHTIGAVAGRRLSDLIAVGPRAGVRPIPAQPEGPGWDGYGRQEHRGRDDAPTPTPAKLADKQAAIEAAAGGPAALPFCPEDGGTCPNMVATGEDKCPEHLGWPRCAMCGHRQVGGRWMRPGATSCGHCATAAGPVSDAELAGLLAEAARRAQPTEAPF